MRKFDTLYNFSNHASATTRPHKDVPLGGSATSPNSRWLSMDSPRQTSSR
jgi:hypothetical protein